MDRTVCWGVVDRTMCAGGWWIGLCVLGGGG